MSDIVERLRDLAAWKPDDDEYEGFDLCAEAADEIERLRDNALWQSVQNGDLKSEIELLRAELAEATDLVWDLAQQGCHYDDVDDTFDSNAISTYADALEWLAERGRVEIVVAKGRRVIARRKDQP